MVSPLFYYQLALLALVWLFLMLHLTWPKRSAATTTAPATPIQSKRKRSNEPKPFAGLTTKPPCALCEREAAHPQPAPPVSPEPMPRTHRRPRTVDTSQHFCPHTGCRYRGWLGLGNVRANGHPSGGRWRQFQCTSCEGYFLETHGTIFHGKQVAVELIVHVLACLAEGLGIRATARVFEVDPNTVLRWLVEAAEQLTAFSAYFLCDVHVNQVQLDELYAVLREVKDGTLSEDEAIKRLERSRHWVWTAIDPESKLVLAIEIGPRTLAMAQCVVHRVVQKLAASCVPLWLTDGNRDYTMAFLAHCGFWHQPERTRAQGPAPQPRWLPLPELLYAQVVKSYRRRRLVAVKPRVVFGTLEAIEQVLAVCGWKINTAFVERLNLSLRQRVAAIGRRSATPCKRQEGLSHQLALFQGYHNFVLPMPACAKHERSPSRRMERARPKCGGRVRRRWRPG